MSFQYHDLTYDPYSHPMEYQNSLQALTPPSDEIFKTSPWSSSSNLMTPTTSNDSEEMNQPERGIAGFVSKLYQCLQAPDDGQKYARWCKRDGIDMFIIDCIPKFTEIVLPKLFKHCKFASFVRQLNIYGFQRDTDARKSKDSRDKETCRWHHIHFRPGRRDLFHLIRRKTPRYSRRKRARTEEEEEDLLLADESVKDSDETDERDSMNSRRYSSSSISSLPSTLQHLPPDNSYDYAEPTYPQFQQPDMNQLTFYNNASTLSHQNSPLIDEPSFCQIQGQIMEQQQQQQETKDQLYQQITELRKGYTRMYKILTDEVNKANNIIDAQRTRIEFLESSLCQQQDLMNSQQQQQVFTPTTPVYPQSFNKQFMPNDMAMYHISSPCALMFNE